MKLRVMTLILAVALAGLACFPFGQSGYGYEGEPFVSLQNESPPAGEYLASDRVRGFIALPRDLDPNLGGGSPADVTDRVAGFFFTDGRSDLTPRNASIVLAAIQTDGRGDILAWDLVIESDDGTRTIETRATDTVLDQGTIREGDGNDVGSTATEGTWTRLGRRRDHGRDHGRDHDHDDDD